MNGTADQPPRRDLAEGLTRLETLMAEMTDLAGKSLDTALALVSGANGSAIDQVLTYDRQIYERKQDIVKTCVDLLALHGPVAKDLRTITATLEIAGDLDRFGRYAKDIGELIRELVPSDRDSIAHLPSLERMGQLTRAMYQRAVTAYRTRDLAIAQDLDRADNEVDDLHEQVFRDVVGRIADSSVTPPAGAALILMNRYFERLADHAVNIGSHVEYMLAGSRQRW